MKIPPSITILVDSREQKPLLFPEMIEWYPSRSGKSHQIQVKTKKATLPAGDYCLEGFDDCVIFERKGGADELAKNLLSDDHRRATAAFQRLVEAAEVPYLLLDCTIPELLTDTKYVPNAAAVVDALLELTRRFGLRLLAGCGTRHPRGRRLVGEFVVRILLSHALREPAGPIDILGILNTVWEDPSGEVIMEKINEHVQREGQRKAAGVRDGGKAGHRRGKAPPNPPTDASIKSCGDALHEWS